MANRILFDHQRRKADNSDDASFYSQPRIVHHLDSAFRRKLTSLYKDRIPKNSIILDLMSSWTSHLPEDILYKKVIGHGLNLEELKQNKRLDSFWVQDLNRNQKLPLEDSSIDTCLMVAAWQYLQEPENIAEEIKRVMKPNGQIIISFSNRAFWQKSPEIWINSNDMERLNYIAAILIAQGWKSPENIIEKTSQKGILGLIGKEGDPFFSVISRK